jgi:predicted  nucleic acid-binding Zn-ribbon protein
VLHMELESLSARLEEHGERLARHDAELQALRESTVRLEAAISDVRAELRDTRNEIRADMVRGFDRLEAAIGRVSQEALQAYTPDAARELARTQAAEARARAWAIALLAGLLTILAAAIGLATHLL